jgi:hypothetical protein
VLLEANPLADIANTPSGYAPSSPTAGSIAEPTWTDFWMKVDVGGVESPR